MLSSLYRQSMIKVLRVPFNVGSSIVTAHFSSTNVNQKESFGTKGLTIVQDLRGLKNAPLPALTLGISGLIPFIAAPWYMTHNVSFSVVCFNSGRIVTCYRLFATEKGFLIPKSMKQNIRVEMMTLNINTSIWVLFLSSYHKPFRGRFSALSQNMP